MLDLTERKRAEQALRDSEELLEEAQVEPYGPLGRIKLL